MNDIEREKLKLRTLATSVLSVGNTALVETLALAILEALKLVKRVEDEALASHTTAIDAADRVAMGLRVEVRRLRESTIRDVIDVCEENIPPQHRGLWGYFRERIDGLLAPSERRKRVLRHLSMRHYRTKNPANATEAVFSVAWAMENSDRPLLPLLLMPDPGSSHRPPPPICQRDATVAATVVQWLGSNVGMCFLRDVLEHPEFASMVETLYAKHRRDGAYKGRS